MEFPLFSALLLGLFSTVHCIGMCGGIMGALTYSLPNQVRSSPQHLFAYLLAYSSGRLASYAAAGAALGLLGEGIYHSLSPGGGYFSLQVAAALLMGGIGLYLAGWFPRFAAVERLGVPLWRRLEPLGRQLLPVRSLPQALLYGMIWGWLPCGLVYSALLLTVTSGGAADGALFMLGFGLGTLPAVMGTGILTTRLVGLTRQPLLRRLAGVGLILLGVAGLLFSEELHRLNSFSAQQPLQCTDERI